jgi:hypothetical protein
MPKTYGCRRIRSIPVFVFKGKIFPKTWQENFDSFLRTFYTGNTLPHAEEYNENCQQIGNRNGLEMVEKNCAKVSNPPND